MSWGYSENSICGFFHPTLSAFLTRSFAIFSNSDAIFNACKFWRKLGDVQNVSVEEANRADGGSPANNDILRKINAILENSLDISSLCFTGPSQDTTQGTRCYSTSCQMTFWCIGLHVLFVRPAECGDIDEHGKKGPFSVMYRPTNFVTRF